MEPALSYSFSYKKHFFWFFCFASFSRHLQHFIFTRLIPLWIGGQLQTLKISLSGLPLVILEQCRELVSEQRAPKQTIFTQKLLIYSAMKAEWQELPSTAKESLFLSRFVTICQQEKLKSLISNFILRNATIITFLMKQE